MYRQRILEDFDREEVLKVLLEHKAYEDYEIVLNSKPGAAEVKGIILNMLVEKWFTL